MYKDFRFSGIRRYFPVQYWPEFQKTPSSKSKFSLKIIEKTLFHWFWKLKLEAPSPLNWHNNGIMARLHCLL